MVQSLEVPQEGMQKTRLRDFLYREFYSNDVINILIGKECLKKKGSLSIGMNVNILRLFK